ncbi:hypothetical protein [Salmonella enterica]|uniref:AAA family ATPase n=1 Tax=Salmonella enterica TaxID=28901 RepID=UPI00398C61C7
MTAGAYPLYVARRFLTMSSEDFGNANLGTIQVAIVAWVCITRFGPAVRGGAISEAIFYLARPP